MDNIECGSYGRPHSQTFESIDVLHTGPGYDEPFQVMIDSKYGMKVKYLEPLTSPLSVALASQNYLALQGQKHSRVPAWITDRVEQWVLELNYMAF